MDQQIEIYTYTITIQSILLKIKFPCRIYLEQQAQPITPEVSASSPNKFIFNQEITLKNQQAKDCIEILVQLVTDKGAKYVGGLIKFTENQLIGSEGERIVMPISKCLDNEAVCQIRVDQVSSYKIIKKAQQKKKPLRSQYQHELSPHWSNQRPKINEGETKSEVGFALNVNRGGDKRQIGGQMLTIAPGGMAKRKRFDAIGFDRQQVGSIPGGGMSSLQFEVYKQGYNKLKQKYRKEAETARAELNKRMLLESNENTLKLEVMRYKMKTEELEKNVADKNNRIRQMTDNLSAFQKKELDIKYLKEQCDNKSYLLKNSEETIKTLIKENNELKKMQQARCETEQETIKNLKSQLEKLRKDCEGKQSELLKVNKEKNEVISKKQYELHIKEEEISRLKCNLNDLEKSLTNKTIEFEKIQFNQRNTFKNKQQELNDKINGLNERQTELNAIVKKLEEQIESKNAEIIRLEYDQKVLLQKYDAGQKEIEGLKIVKDKYSQLMREHKIVGEEKINLEKTKEKQKNYKDSQIEELNQRYLSFNQNSKKAYKQLEDKHKVVQTKLIEMESQNELMKSQLEKARRQNQLISKENSDLKAAIKELKSQIKSKDEGILNLNNELTEAKSKFKQGDFSIKLQLDRIKQQNEKLSKSIEQEKERNNELKQLASQLELEGNKAKMEWQFKQQKAAKELGYAKDKIASLQAFKTDLENQLASVNSTLASQKTNEKSLNEKIHKYELEIIKYKDLVQKAKKDCKISEEKLQNSDNNLKNKIKEITELQLNRENLEKQLNRLEGEKMQLKSDLNKETNEKLKHQKITEILQSEIDKGKEEQSRLNTVIAAKEKAEEGVREELKKQKEEYTKLDMKLSTLRKQYEKFKDSMVQNLHTVFGSIPDGTIATSIKQLKADKLSIRENSEILNLLTTLGKETRSNVSRLIEEQKLSQKQIEKMNNEINSTVNKSSNVEIQYSQTISKLEDEISELIAEKQNLQNKYEEEVFLLEGRIGEKQSIINDLSQQIEELDFTCKTTKSELLAFEEEVNRKDLSKSKTIKELKDQIEYQLEQVNELEKTLQKAQEQLELTEDELEEKVSRIARLEKQLEDLKDTNFKLADDGSQAKRELKKANDKIEELSLELIAEKDEVQKYKQSVEDEEKKSSELRQFLSNLMKQKEEIIKKELEKSEQILESETKIEQMKHEIEGLTEEIKKHKKALDEAKEQARKNGKAIKDLEFNLSEEKAKNSKLSDKVKEKERELQLRDETIQKNEEKIKRDKEKSVRTIKQLEEEVNENHLKLLTKQKQLSQNILTLESANNRLKDENSKYKQEIIALEEEVFSAKNENEELRKQLAAEHGKVLEYEENIKSNELKISEYEEELNLKEENTFKLQNNYINLENHFQVKAKEAQHLYEQQMQDLKSKYEASIEDYEHRIELAEKEKESLKDKLEEKERENRKCSSESKSLENNLNLVKKTLEEKIKILEEDRLALISQKNTENQRLAEEGRVHFENLKAKQSQYRKLTSELEIAKSQISKFEAKVKEAEEKLKGTLKIHQSENEEFKKKEQSFKKYKEAVTSTSWKCQRQARQLVQGVIKKMLEVVDEESTLKIVEITKSFEQSLLSAMEIKIDERDI